MFDYLVGCMSGLFRFHNYGAVEEAYATLLFIAGLSLRDVSERHRLTRASRESVRGWAYRLRTLSRAWKRRRRLVAVDEAVVKRFGHPEYVWAAVDVDSGEILDAYARRVGV